MRALGGDSKTQDGINCHVVSSTNTTHIKMILSKKI
jgi:hypothetical protein